MMDCISSYLPGNYRKSRQGFQVTNQNDPQRRAKIRRGIKNFASLNKQEKEALIGRFAHARVSREVLSLISDLMAKDESQRTSLREAKQRLEAILSR